MNLHLKFFPFLTTTTIIFLLSIIEIFPQAGLPDSSFGQSGKVMTSVNVFGSSFCRASTIQSDGKIVSAGYCDGAGFSGNSFAVTRSNPDGTQDISFGVNGIVVTPVGTGDAYAHAITVQSDGKIIAAGNYDNGNNNDFILIRYLTDGTVDSTFGANGLVITQIGTDEGILAVTIQNDGGEEKIIAAGYSDDDFAIARYNSDGYLDNSFGNSGIKTTQVGNGANFASDVVVQDVGGQQKILAAGRSNHNGDYDFAAARFNSGGSLDNSFGTNGIVITPIGNGNDFAEAVAVQNDNKIVVGGYSFDSGSNLFALVRYDENGMPDNSFGTNGIVTTSLGINSGFIYSLAIQNDGKIVAGGQAYDLNDFDFAIARYNTNGSLDNSFGNNGIVITSISPENDFGYSVILQNTEAGGEKIIATGESFNGSDIDFVLVRYETDGSLDLSFGTTGLQKIEIGSSFTQLQSVAIQSNGKIVVGGYTENENGDYDFLIVRYNVDGRLDDTFGASGIVITQIGNDHDRVYAVIIQELVGGIEKILVVGVSENATDFDIALARYNHNGSLDNTFGNGGIVITQVGSEDDVALSADIQSDGKIVVAGYVEMSGEYNSLTVRYNENGSIDNTFGNNGVVITPIGSGNDFSTSVEIQNDGKIVTAGYADLANNDFAVVRYNNDGELDNSFGTNGITITSLSNLDDFAYSLEIQNDGKIILAGYSETESMQYDYALVRYNSNGSVDNTFGSNGFVITDLGKSNERIYSMALQPDGKIVIGGYFSDYAVYNFALARYNSFGELDNTFGIDGVIIDHIGSSENFLRSVKLQSDGKIVAVGYSSESNVFYSAITLARYHGDKSADVKLFYSASRPISFSLEQNYPNPFNPITTIRFTVPQSSFVTLEIFNTLGERIDVLVSQELTAGIYNYVWNADNLTSGVYFYTLSTNEYINTKKMILMK